jgi:hypothetical protein
MSTDDEKKLPVVRSSAGLAKGGKPKSSFLAKVRAAKATPPVTSATSSATPPQRGDRSLITEALKPKKTRPRLVFAIDATASREPAWEVAKATTDALFGALPGKLDVALAVHGGSRVKLFTAFTAQPDTLRDAAASVSCEAGNTRLVEVMERCRDADDVRVLVYIGDVFEERLADAESAAGALRLRGTRVIILHDREQAPQLDASGEAFQTIARITEGAVLPFEASSTAKLRELLEAIATLAVGGVKLLERRRRELPAAGLLLKQLPSTTER